MKNKGDWKKQLKHEYEVLKLPIWTAIIGLIIFLLMCPIIF